MTLSSGSAVERLTARDIVSKMPDMQQQKDAWFGRWLRACRERSKVSTIVIGKALGVSPSTVLSRERGGIVTVDALPAVIAAYGITPKQLADEVKLRMP